MFCGSIIKYFHVYIDLNVSFVPDLLSEVLEI